MSDIKRRPHTWDAEGEQCTLCGENEWIGTHCPGTVEERTRAAAHDLLEALEQLVRPYGVADVGMANAPAPLQMEFIAAVRKAKDAIAKARGSA